MNDLYGRWATVYDYFYPDRAEEVTFWARLAEGCGRRLLDLMCGTAEVSLGLARSGFRVTGLDRSSSMLAVATERLSAAADHPARNLSLLHGDARAIPAAEGAFDFCLVGGNGSLNHLDGDAGAAALRELGRVLRPGGVLGMELVNGALLKEVYPVRTFGPFRPTPPGVSVEKTSHNHYDPVAGLFHIRQITRTRIDGQDDEFEESFALYVWQPDEVTAMLETAGFEDVRFYGDYELGPFDRWSSDLLVVGRKKRATHLSKRIGVRCP